MREIRTDKLIINGLKNVKSIGINENGELVEGESTAPPQDTTPADGIKIHLAEGKTFGKYKNGDVIPAGLSAIDLIKEALTENVVMTFDKPIYNVRYKKLLSFFTVGGNSIDSACVGQSLDIEIEREFLQKDSGGVLDFEVFCNDVLASKTSDLNVVIPFRITEEDPNFKITSTANYKAGTGVKTNSIGVEYVNNVKAGSVIASNIDYDIEDINANLYYENMFKNTEIEFNSPIYTFMIVEMFKTLNGMQNREIHTWGGSISNIYFDVEKNFEFFIPNNKAKEVKIQFRYTPKRISDFQYEILALYNEYDSSIYILDSDVLEWRKHHLTGSISIGNAGTGVYPNSPQVNDVFLDDVTGEIYLWNGSNWGISDIQGRLNAVIVNVPSNQIKTYEVIQETVKTIDLKPLLTVEDMSNYTYKGLNDVELVVDGKMYTFNPLSIQKYYGGGSLGIFYRS